MKSSRLTLVAAVSSALVLTACTDAQTSDPGSSSTTAGSSQTTESSTTDAAPATDAAETSASTPDGSASTESADAAGSTEDGTGTTAAAGADDESATAEMTTDEATAAVSVEEAEAVAAGLLEARRVALKTSDTATFQESADAAMAGSARQVISGSRTLESVFGKTADAELSQAPEPNVLSISREDGEGAAYLLVQTVPDPESAPWLHLMSSPSGEAADFRIVWEAPMLPGTEIPAFDRRSVGTPVLRSGQGELRDAPRDTIKALAAWISWPLPDDDTNPGIRTHGYVPAVRDAAEAQAAAVAEQARLREKNWLVSDDTTTLMFEDGTALVVGSILRDTTFTVNAGSTLTPPDSFRVLAGDDSISEEAVLRTMVFVAMRVPSEEIDFKPEMLAAQEQLVDAWGN